MPGALGSRYVLDEIIGRGAMGEVWRGHARDDGRALAFKLLQPGLAGDEAFVTRFIREKTVLQRIASSHVVQVHDMVVEGDRLGIVMDLVEGRDLRRELIDRGTLPPAEAMWLVASILDGVSAAHAVGVVHRDLKPENVLLDRGAGGGVPVPKVTDFGIAFMVHESRLTSSSVAIGTPQYMAPELAEGHEVSPAVDLYAAGTILYELLCGVTPFGGGHPLTVLRRQVDLAPGRPDGLPDELWNLIDALLAKDPAQRPPTAAAVASHLADMAGRVGDLPALGRLETPPPAHATTSGAQATTSASGARPPADAPDGRGPTGSRRRGWAALAGGAAAAVLAVAVAVALIIGDRDGDATTPGATLQGSDGSAAATSSTSPRTSSASPSPTPTTPGVMPNLVGQTLEDAEETLDGLGVTPRIINVLDERNPDGTVVGQTPETGALLDETSVELQIAREPALTYLSEQDPVEGSVSSTAIRKINGEDYLHSVAIKTDCGQDRSAQFDLGRDYRRFLATLGMDDSSPSDVTYLFEIYADQKKLAEHRLTLGQEQAVDVDVTGALRLRIVVTGFSDSGNCYYNAYGVFGDARIAGVPGEVPTATPSPS